MVGFGEDKKLLFLFILCYISYAILYSTRKPFSVVKSDIQDDLGLPTMTLGSIDTAFLASYAVGQMIIPSWSETLGGPRICILLSFVGSGMCAIVFGMAGDPVTFVGAWIVNGICNAGVFPLLVRILAPACPEEIRGRVMGAWTTSQQLGSISSTALTAFLASKIGWRAAFIVPAFVVALNGVVYFFTLPYLEDKPTSTSKNSKQKDGPSRPWTVWDALRIPEIRNLAGAYFCIKLVRYSLLGWLPYFLAKDLNYSQSVAGYASMMFDLGGVLGAMLTGVCSDRFFGRRRLLTAALSAVGAFFGMIAFGWGSHHGLVPTLFTMFLLGVFIAGPDSVLGAAAAQDVCDRNGLGLAALSASAGIINGMGSCGAVLQGYVTAGIAEKWGWDALFFALGVVCLCSVGFLYTPITKEAAAVAQSTAKKDTDSGVELQNEHEHGLDHRRQSDVKTVRKLSSKGGE